MGENTEFDRENEAAWIVSAMVLGVPHRLDHRSKFGKPLECDFVIELPGGAQLILEVTSSTVRHRAQQSKLIGGGTWQCPGITRNWSVQLDGAGPWTTGARITQFKLKAPPFFAVLEEEVPFSYGDLLNPSIPNDLSRTANDAITALNKLGARHGTLLDRPQHGPPGIALGWVYDGVANDPSLNEVVGRAAQSNQSKLEKYFDSQRHLFVWIDQTDYRNYADLFNFQIPTTPALIPEAIDQVWVGPWAPGISYEGSLQSLISTNGTDLWMKQLVPRISNYYEHFEKMSDVKLDHLINGIAPFGRKKPWRTIPTR